MGIEFYSNILSFEKLSDIEVAGEDYERLQGVFAIHVRVVRMQLGEEFIDLTEYDDVIISDCGLRISNFIWPKRSIFVTPGIRLLLTSAFMNGKFAIRNPQSEIPLEA